MGSGVLLHTQPLTKTLSLEKLWINCQLVWLNEMHYNYEIIVLNHSLKSLICVSAVSYFLRFNIIFIINHFILICHRITIVVVIIFSIIIVHV